MKNSTITYLTIFLLVFFVKAKAQQDNLWTTEFGSRSTMVAGAVTASVRDNSAIYYNPGALGFIKNSNIGLSANIVNYYTTYIKNGAGEKNNIYYPYLSFVPQFISGVVKSKKIPDITFTYAAFNKHKSKLDFFQKSSKKIDLYPQFAGDEEFSSTYRYYDEIVETWVGLGAGYLLNPNWSVGLSMFFSYRSQVNQEMIDNVVFDENDNIVANTIFSNELNFGQLAVIYKAGIAYEDEYINWGATITTTGMRIGLFTGTMLNRSENVKMPGEEDHYYSIYNSWTNAWYKHPWEFDTGIQFALGGGTFNVRASYFIQIRTYTMAEFDDEAIVSSNDDTPLLPKRNILKYSTKPILNFAFGYEKRISDNIDLLMGFKVDRNVFNSEELDREEYWVATKSYWNLYTASIGADYITEKDNNIIFGVSYRFNNRRNDTQLINITNPDVDNYLLGEKTNTADTNINGFSLVVGYTFNFGKSTKKDIRDKINIDELNPFDKN